LRYTGRHEEEREGGREMRKSKKESEIPNTNVED
jgi:hypothetical protein